MKRERERGKINLKISRSEFKIVQFSSLYTRNNKNGYCCGHFFFFPSFLISYERNWNASIVLSKLHIAWNEWSKINDFFFLPRIPWTLLETDRLLLTPQFFLIFFPFYSTISSCTTRKKKKLQFSVVGKPF